MIRHRWAIPVSLGIVCVGLGITSVATSSVTRAMPDGIHRFSVGDSRVWTGTELKAGEKYRLQIAPRHGIPLNTTAVVSAELTRNDAVVFELEDAYWHESGVWREGGESGTWEEQNASTAFTFRVPETGEYDLELSLDSASNSPETLLVRIDRIEQFPLAAWPLFLGGVLLFGMGGASFLGRRGVMGKYIEDLGPGSCLTIAGTEYTVIERSEQWEDHSRIGVELRLRDVNGASRYLAVDRFEYEHPWSEEDTLVTLLLIEVPPPVSFDGLAGVQRGETHVALGDTIYRRDPENSGFGTVGALRNGETFRSRYFADVYHAHPHLIPMHPGGLWLERIEWLDSGHVEWSLMEIVDWKTVDVIELVPAETIDRDTLFKTADHDPLGIGGQPRDPFGAPPGSPTTEPRHSDEDVAPIEVPLSTSQPESHHYHRGPGADPDRDG